jgi:hypothetical protein
MNAHATVRFDHLDRMSDERGLFEHADGTIRRLEHGYCTDDNARLLVVTSRQPDTRLAHGLSRVALRFVLDALDSDGRCHNRMDLQGRWTDDPSVEDCWGRSVWGLGVAASQHRDPNVRQQARQGFNRAVQQRSPWSRSMAFAALGAADVLTIDAQHRGARELLADAVTVIGQTRHGTWKWPEPRLTYANATVAEAVIAAGAMLDRHDVLTRGLTMLAWLLELETRDGHLSVVGVGGRGPDDVGPFFDQQPIEVAAMADACWRAYTVTDDPSWLRGVSAAVQWFDADNDTGLVMRDTVSGGGYDGLHPDRVNLNQGAESTLALVSTMQRARSLVAVP